MGKGDHRVEKAHHMFIGVPFSTIKFLKLKNFVPRWIRLCKYFIVIGRHQFHGSWWRRGLLFLEYDHDFWKGQKVDWLSNHICWKTSKGRIIRVDEQSPLHGLVLTRTLVGEVGTRTWFTWLASSLRICSCVFCRDTRKDMGRETASPPDWAGWAFWVCGRRGGEGGTPLRLEAWISTSSASGSD